MKKSLVEDYYLEQAVVPFLDRKHEKIPVLTVDNYNCLGQVCALRFLEWVSRNPDGVVSLQAGRSSQYFIRWLRYYIDHWQQETRGGILEKTGLSLKKPPSFSGLSFVQMCEFLPLSPAYERTFQYFVRKYYIEGLGMDASKALLMDIAPFLPSGQDTGTRHRLEDIFPDGVIDLKLRYALPTDDSGKLQKSAIRYIDQFCEDYEERIRSGKGLGFFLCAIGQDGHIALNMRGASHHSSTRLTSMNYETMAVVAPDLGGIELARGRGVVTIGLETITFNPDCTAIVFASGEDKAESVAGAVELAPCLDHPGTALQKLQHARVYVTRGAAARLTERRFRSLTASGPISDREIDRLIIDGARISGIPLAEVKAAKKNAASPQQTHLRAAENIAHRKLSLLIDQTCDNLSQAIQKGMNIPEQQRFLHTGPHHDDIELAYFPLLHHLVRSPKNHNYFCYLTSGFTSVTNDFVMQSMMILAQAIKSSTLYSVIHRDDVYDPRKRAIEINEYLNAIAQQNMSASGLYRAIRLFRRIAQDIRSDSDYSVLSFAEEQIALLRGHIPGSKVPETIKQIKSWIREWEAELVWAHFGLDNSNIFHLGLRFYSDNLFPDDLDIKKDVAPIVRLLQKVNPTIVTLAMDPEGSGPDTHYKTLLAMRAALQAYMKKRGGSRPRIWGYRNVWSQFHPAQVNMIVPVSLNSFAVLHNMFNTCFLSQKTASFPSSKFDGTFSELAQKIWVQQFNDITALLGKRFFYDDKHPMMRRAYGAIYLRDMSYDEFMAEMDRLK